MCVCEDTLCPDLRQSLDLTGAAGQRLSHDEEQVGVVDAFGVEQPTEERQENMVVHTLRV